MQPKCSLTFTVIEFLATMKQITKVTGLSFALLFLSVLFSIPQDLPATQKARAQVGARIRGNVTIELDGGRNEFGKQTTLSGNSIDFGVVSFASDVANGDAYLYNENLMLEAILEVDVTFSAARKASVYLSKLRHSTRSFNNNYFSTEQKRTTRLTKILENPQKNTVATLTKRGAFDVRLIFQ